MPLTILFVHGTGVRNAGYVVSLDKVRAKVREFGIAAHVDEFLWGDVLGVDFEGLCLPDPPERTEEDEADAKHWDYLQDDPLFDLRMWNIPGTVVKVNPLSGVVNQGKEKWQQVERYQPSLLLTTMLEQRGLKPFFAPAWKAIVATGLPATAFAGAGDEIAAVSRAFADAVVAQMAHDVSMADDAEITLPLIVRQKLRNRLLYDWDQITKGIKDRVRRFLGRVTEKLVRPARARVSRAIAPAIGDILRYQSIGIELRDLLRKRIELIPGDVLLLSHSLGGVACFELLVDEQKRPQQVKGLVTVGSQAPLFYEFDALSQIAKGKQPVNFPPWLNIYDENDVLSYRAKPLFPVAIDKQVDSVLQPFLAHSAYWELDETWESIRDFAAALP